MAHSYTNLIFHIIYATKERRPFIDDEFQPRLYDYTGGAIRGLKGTSLEIGGVEDHVHILTKLPPTIAVADFLEKLKANTSKWGKSVRRGFGWQEGYSAFTVSESQVTRVRRYIQNQREHHAKISYRDELIALLEAHGIKYDPDRI
jgi:REP element-mobilizing transposase RayT